MMAQLKNPDEHTKDLPWTDYQYKQMFLDAVNQITFTGCANKIKILLQETINRTKN
jgi:hypothetical protein